MFKINAYFNIYFDHIHNLCTISVINTNESDGIFGLPIAAIDSILSDSIVFGKGRDLWFSMSDNSDNLFMLKGFDQMSDEKVD